MLGVVQCQGECLVSLGLQVVLAELLSLSVALLGLIDGDDREKGE